MHIYVCDSLTMSPQLASNSPCSAIWSGNQRLTCFSLLSSGISGMSLSITPEFLKQKLNAKAYYSAKLPQLQWATTIRSAFQEREALLHIPGLTKAMLMPILHILHLIWPCYEHTTARKPTPVTNSRVPGSLLVDGCQVLVFFPLLSRED